MVFDVKLGASIIVINEPRNHTHHTNEDLVARQMALQNMTAFVRADPCAPVRAAYDHTVSTNRQLASSRFSSDIFVC